MVRSRERAAHLNGTIRNQLGCLPCGLEGSRPSTVGAICKDLEGRGLWRSLGGWVSGTGLLPT